MLALVVLLAAVPVTPSELPKPAASPVATADVTAEGRKLLLKCEKAFLRIGSMKGTIREKAIEHDHSEDEPAAETESDFLYKRIGGNENVRFENVVPLPHSVIFDGKTIWIWSPRENAAVQEPLERVDIQTRAALSLQPGFGIDPLAPIPLDEFRTEVKKIEGPKGTQTVVTLTPLDSKAPRATMQLVVDPEKLLVTRIVSLAGEGTALADVELTDPVEAKPGIWFATKVHTRMTVGDGTTLERLRSYERLKFDAPIEDSKFTFQVPEGAKIVPLEQATGKGAKKN